MRIAMILPPREVFSPQAAGAIALVVQRLAGAAGAYVIGGVLRYPAFANIGYIPAGNPFAVVRALWRQRPEIIEIHQQPRLARILALLFPAARIILFLHNDPLTMRGLRTPRARHAALARLHCIVCVSAYLRDRFMQGVAGPRRPEVLPNPLSLAALPPPAARRSRLILFAGRIVAEKGVEDFIAACAQALPSLPGWRAAIIGGDRFGPASPETGFVTRMRSAAVSAGIDFTGPLPHRAVLEAMADAAIIAVPSRWPEPFGLAALEALASGAALITTAQGGLPEVACAAAIYIPPHDPTALAAALQTLAGDEPRRLALAKAGIAQAQTFDTPVIAARLQRLRDAK